MVDYNDGKWHAWDGGDIPVHDKTVVMVVGGWDDAWETTAHEENVTWKNVAAFRVVKEYKEPPKPREFWILTDGYVCTRKPMSSGWIHVREVLE